MPTPILIDSFQGRVLKTAIPVAAISYYSTVDDATALPSHNGTDITFDTGVVRTADHAVSMKFVENGTTAVDVRRAVSAGVQNSVVSFYLKIASAPSTQSRIFFLNGPAARLEMDTSGNFVYGYATGAVTTALGSFADDAWHRIDIYANSSASPNTMDMEIDGVSAGAQASRAQAATDVTTVNIGSTVTTHTLTFWISDFVMSNTGADYPMGDHICKKLEISGTGTHNKGSGAFTDEAGNTTDAELLNSVDDAWDGTTPNLTQTGEDHVVQTANDGAAYLEFTLVDPADGDTDIWGAQLASLMASLDAATANTAETRLVDSGGNTLATTGLVDPSVSSSAYTGYRVIATSPGGDGWTNTELDGVKIRFGFSTDAAPDAAFNSGMVEYVAAWTPPAATGETLTIITAGV